MEAVPPKQMFFLSEHSRIRPTEGSCRECSAPRSLLGLRRADPPYSEHSVCRAARQFAPSAPRGKILPLVRSGATYPLAIKKAMADFRENAFLLDFENWCLQHCWHGEIPKGPGRIENPEWAAMMRKECEESDTTFERYCAWVRQGGGDEWFQS